MFWIITEVFGGICNGSFALPMKFTKKWEWENMWSMWSIWTLLVVPWTIAFLTVPNLFDIYSQTARSALLLVFAFGLIWGIGAVCTGLGLDYLGLGIGYSTIMGLVIAIGSLAPLIARHPEEVLKARGMTIIAGVIIIIVALVFNARAALAREKDLGGAEERGSSGRKKSVITGIIICVISGIASPTLNFAFIAGEKFIATAETLGTNRTLATTSIWAITLTGGFVFNFAYCMWLVRKNKTANLYLLAGTKLYYLYTLMMGVLWAGSIAIYGIATVNMGELGPSIGWALFSGVAIFTANILGVLSGEWKGATPKSIRTMRIALAILLVGICVVGWSKAM